MPDTPLAAVPEEHPFAPFVRILGKGKTGTRSLSQAEAREAFGMILRNEVEPLQLGAFLMLLRVKEESGEELAGFVQACRDTIDIQGPAGRDTAPSADLDWSSYAGKKHQHPWYLLSILLLTQAGYRVFIHGAGGHTAGRLYTEQAMAQLGLPVARDWNEVGRQLDTHGLSYFSLAHFCRGLYDIMQLKPILGLRSPVNTFARMLNPLRAPASIQSIFHPAYAALHREADRLLGQPRSLVFKGDSGEVEIKPQATTRLIFQFAGEPREKPMPRVLEDKVASVAQPSVAPLRALWRDEAPDAYGELAATATAAAALQVLEPTLSTESALERARSLWQQRDRERLPSCP
ncbi:glycosyl transferase family protein [Parahaliea mediterranea]|uniref:Glycosyl transferase family protein n=1 Tax=Parahaliea mediterranea TaxID=651086 RepID=A0A939IN71_9GAMM|nr:glycosyl transferase family protein [Parahaliea mediterranea]MBN7797747.1 glycosyl transferase family protein [Parahaliea mediterranea]